MEDQSQVGVDNQVSIPTLNDLQSQQVGGLVSPFSIEPSTLNLPQPPKSYPVGVPASNLIPTQQGSSDYDKLFNNLANDYSDLSWANDPLKYSQAESYNADYDGANFERYYKVPSVFKQKGFSPYRDNEKIYNENATWFDYYKRSLGAMGDGFASGFTDMLPWNSWSSDVTDIEAARNMERAHAIGADNRGGFGSFMNNMTVDFGYTGGILAEFAAEEIAMWVGAALAAPESGGASIVGAGVETASQVSKLGKLFKKAMTLETYSKKLAQTKDWIRNADKMRDIYSAAKTGATKLGKGLVDATIPETFKYADEMMQLGKKGELVFDMAKTAKGFGALYRDARRVTAAVSESAMEGGSSELEVRKRLADEIYATGRAPSQEEWDNIYAKAADAGKETFWWNLPVLYASNAIVFEKAFKGFKPMDALREELTQGIKGKLMYKEGWKALGEKAWDVVDDGFVQSVKSLGKLETYKPKNFFPSVIGKFANYTKANLAEGFQEVYQDAVQKTMNDYYTNQFYHPAVAGARSTWGAFADNASMLNPFGESSQTFLSGFLMGSMATVPQKVAFEWIPKKFTQVVDPKGYQEYEDNLKRHTNSVVDALNAATMDNKFFDAITVNANQQFNNKKEAELANMAGDKRAFYTITDNAVGEHLHTLISTGKINLIKDHLEDLKQLKPSELEEAFGPIDKSQGDPETFYQNKIQGMIDKIDLVDKHTQRIEKRFPNVFNPAAVDKKRNPEGYQKELTRYRAFELAKKAAIMSSYNFDRTVQRIESIANKLTQDYDKIWTGPNMKFSQTMGSVAATNLSTILNVNSIEASIDLLKSEVDTYSKGDAQSQKKAEASRTTLEDLEDLKASIQEVQLLSFISKEEGYNPDSERVAEAKTASRITKGTKVKNKKGETVTVAQVKRGYAYDKAGNRIGKSKKLEIVGGEQESDDYLNIAGQNLYNAYSKYIKNVAKQAGLTVHQDAIDSTFQDYKDLFLLGADMQEYADHIDILHNPKGLLSYASRTSQVLGTIKEQQRELIEKAYKEFLDFKDTNDLFGELYKKGLFLDEEGMKNILDKKLPNTFYKISDMSPVVEGDPLVDEIDLLLDQYEKAKGFTFEGRKRAQPETEEEEETTPISPVSTTTVTQTPPEEETGPITKETSIERLRTVGLLPPLVKAFRDFVNNAYDTDNLEVLYRLNPRFANITKEDFNKFSDDQLASMNSFKTYLGYSNPSRMMADYNRKAGLVPTEPETTPTVDWNNLIDKAVSEKELDSIMDQMDEAGAMTSESGPDFLMAINKKRESIKSKAPVTPPVTPTSTDTETKSALKDVESTAKALEEPFGENTKGFKPDVARVNSLLNSYTLGDKLFEETGVIGKEHNDRIDRGVDYKSSRAIYDRELALKISEAYHKAKADESNPELVKAVEDLIASENKPIQKPGEQLTMDLEEAPEEITGEIITETYDKPWRDDKTKVNKATSFALKNKPNEKFELVEDLEPGYYSVHFKTTSKDALTLEEKQKLIQAIADTIPDGGKLSTWGNLTKGGLSGLNRFKNAGFNESGETREVADKENNPLTIPVLIKGVVKNKEEKPKQKAKAKTKATISREERADLRAKGYKPAEYVNLSREEIDSILEENLSKQDRLDRDERLAAEEIERIKAEKTQSTQQKIDNVKSLIEDAEFLEDFKDIDNEISLIIASDPLLNLKELENLIAEKKASLAENPIFENIKVNEIIQLNNNKKYIVLNKTDKNIEVRLASDETKKSFKINVKQFDKTTRDTNKSYVTMRVEPGVEIISTAPVITTDDLNTIKDNFKESSGFKDSEEVEADIAMGKKLTAAERRKNIINNIKSCGL